MRFNKNKLELLRYINMNINCNTNQIISIMKISMTKQTCVKNLRDLRQNRMLKYNKTNNTWKITKNGRSYLSKYTLSYEKAKEIHSKRSKKARKIDERSTSKNTTNTPNTNWVSNPGGSDIWGIDTKKEQAKNIDEIKLYLISMYKRSGGKLLKQKQFKDSNNTSTIIHIKEVSNSEYTRNYIKTLLEVRYNNIIVKRLSSKKNNKDFRISITK